MIYFLDNSAVIFCLRRLWYLNSWVFLASDRGVGAAAERLSCLGTALCPGVRQAQHHQPGKAGDCPALLCAGVASPWILCSCGHHSVKNILNYWRLSKEGQPRWWRLWRGNPYGVIWPVQPGERGGETSLWSTASSQGEEGGQTGISALWGPGCPEVVSEEVKVGC